MLGPNLYLAQLKRMARSLHQEGLSQTEIGKELGVPQCTISRWLKGQPMQTAYSEPVMQKALSTAPAPRYLVVRCDWLKLPAEQGTSAILVQEGVSSQSGTSIASHPRYLVVRDTQTEYPGG